ncbi:MAG: hypothetical protein ACLPW4_05280 [Candidatus Sulfotelmatobacter sp.]
MSQPGRGRISEGPTDALIERTLEFVRTELAGWRDDRDRAPEEAEERLNAQLCKYLNVAASHRFPMVLFSHEEKQTGTRRVDMSALPISGEFIGQTYHTIYDPFLVFEGKRLPAPSRRREREYVTGGAEKSGGIQRFKLALHGARQTTAAMIGYIQEGNVESWRTSINRWIREVAGDASALEEEWSVHEQLTDLAEDPALHVASASSVHKRSGSAISQELRIRHLWVVMRN